MTHYNMSSPIWTRPNACRQRTALLQSHLANRPLLFLPFSSRLFDSIECVLVVNELGINTDGDEPAAAV